MINAIKYMDDLIETGFTQEQSKTTVSMWMELMNENLATKNELKALELAAKSELKEVKTSLENKIEKLDLKMEKEFAAVRSEMKDIKFSLIYTLGSLIVGSVTVLGYFLKH